MIRVFKNKWFNHWARKEDIADDVLLDAAKEEAALSIVAESFVSTTEKQVQQLLAVGSIWEIVS